ncbi:MULTISPECIES: hypothetical protein [unclassified Pseudomonas]|uniref:hypothetical protein n=1 Tax=unclassified Pseudomonas TaxID=196821 RepID=UPI002448C535|nr:MULTISPECIES: hypothetical protein [unclassified Pseudomonas]MDH0893135.1 hypothetical protein [Pseudomonas sp. GD03875]MDH1063044.1 hypothetical protein [Pseudomonas sp. GD03985]
MSIQQGRIDIHHRIIPPAHFGQQHSEAVLRELVAPARSAVRQRLPSPWSLQQLAGIARGHALRLFPCFAGRGEAVVAAPVANPNPPCTWLGWSVTQPLAVLAQRLKD